MKGLLILGMALLAGGWVGLAGDAVGLAPATRTAAEASLARGVAWLLAQQGADGRVGTNENAAVTALALRAVRGASSNATAVRWAEGGGAAGAVFAAFSGDRHQPHRPGGLQRGSVPADHEVAGCGRAP